MNTALRLLTIGWSALITCGACHSTTSVAPQAPDASSSLNAAESNRPPKALEDLRIALGQARKAGKAEQVSTGGSQPLGALIGMTGAEIRAALGEPSTCTRNAFFDANGSGHPVAPCQNRTDWFYSFYHLPQPSLGGGPELLLQFDSSGKCTNAQWMHTQ